MVKIGEKFRGFISIFCFTAKEWRGESVLDAQRSSLNSNFCLTTTRFLYILIKKILDIEMNESIQYLLQEMLRD